MRNKRHKEKKSKRNSIVDGLRILAFLMPLPLFLLFTEFIFPPLNESFLVLGYLGTFFLGIGFALLLGLLNGEYWGHAFTSIPLALGTILIGVCISLVYSPSLSRNYDQAFVDYYFLIWIFISVVLIWYIFFRMAIKQSLRTMGISKTQIKKDLKGTVNFWFYEKIHKKYGYTTVYILNKLFVIATSACSLLHLLIGWWRLVSFLIAGLLCLICLLASAMWAFAAYQWSCSEFGEGFVVFRHSGKTKKWYGFSGLSMFAGVLFPLLMCAATALTLLRLHNIF